MTKAEDDWEQAKKTIPDHDDKFRRDNPDWETKHGNGGGK